MTIVYWCFAFFFWPTFTVGKEWLRLWKYVEIITEIGEIAGAAEVTVKQTYKLLYPRAAELFPEEYKYSTNLDSLPTS